MVHDLMRYGYLKYLYILQPVFLRVLIDILQKVQIFTNAEHCRLHCLELFTAASAPYLRVTSRSMDVFLPEHELQSQHHASECEEIVQ